MPAYRFTVDALNAYCVRLGGTGGHRRTIRALNEICVRLGGTGGHALNLRAMAEWGRLAGASGTHRTMLSALNAINQQTGGPGGFRRSLAAVADLAGRGTTPAPAERITSGSVRSKLPSGHGGTFTGGERAIHRQRDRSNVAVDRPWLEYFHGRVISTGGTGIELETAISGGVTSNYRVALLTGISGTGKDQSAATLTRASFAGMRADAAFIAAGGSVSADGFTVTVPNAVRFRTDRFALSLAAGQEYFIQTECVAANGSAGSNPRGRYCVPALGDNNVNQAAASTADLVFAKNWSTAANASAGSAMGPVAVLGTGTAPVVIVDGDSIICEAATPGTGTNGTDIGDALGVKGFAKRALNAAGYAFIDVSVSGTNVGNFMAGFGLTGLRASLMQHGAAVITDHLHNDRRTGVAFAARSDWTPATPANWALTGLRTRYEWHNDWLRTKLRAGARIVRCTLAPHTNSTDGWVTTTGQTGKNDDGVWAADYATGTNGDQFKLNDLIMRRGAFAGVQYGTAGQPDAAYDLYAALGGTADGRWPVNGTLNWATGDGTHPSESRQIVVAAHLRPLLPGLLGF